MKTNDSISLIIFGMCKGNAQGAGSSHIKHFLKAEPRGAYVWNSTSLLALQAQKLTQFFSLILW
jgi:hypothetical protein